MELQVDRVPTFEYSAKIDAQCRQLSAYLRDCRNISNRSVKIRLHKISRLKSIHSTLLIESNGLTLNTMRDLINGKTVEGPFDEIVEAKNAIAAYGLMDKVDLSSEEDFLKVESVMMWALVPANGYRDGMVGVYNGSEWEYIAPPAEKVPELMSKLFGWFEGTGYPPFVSGAIMHFYIESIHPFRDGNGRMGRIWHNGILKRMDRTFSLVSIEDLIRENQQTYYDVLKACQQDMDCTPFVEFCLDLLIQRLARISELSDERIAAVLSKMDDGFVSASVLMRKLGLSNRSNFLKNYLRPAIACGFVEMSDPEHPHAHDQKYRSNLF